MTTRFEFQNAIIRAVLFFCTSLSFFEITETVDADERTDTVF